ncbi:signal recognition particle receptor alpha subunit [Cyclospora cayetanensis]|uniref:Signal recognition particle receptor alpha subunit n=1 Tax=Cyclospora cayetanensis TaxID=88456 RepID=A0A1D3CRU7_9EIME|nr:signal recognition particle receptor alpha subunit [Cyclospora cayetanensis]
MLDYCCCFTRGGVLLWNFCFAKVPISPINQLIENVLLEERVGSTCASIGGYCFQWFCVNSLQLIFVAAYRGVRTLAVVDQLLQQTAQAFEQRLKGINNLLDYPLHVGEGPDPFDDTFLRILTRVQQKGQEAPPARQQQQQEVAREAKYAKRVKEKDVPQNNKGTDIRYWAGDNKITRKSMEALDYSLRKRASGTEEVHMTERRTYGADSDYASSSEDEVQQDGANESGWFSFFPKALQNFTGNKLLTEKDIEDVLPFFPKNVAEEVIDLLLASVRRNLLGTRTATLTSVHQTVKTAMRESIAKLLTPKRSVDVLRLCLQARAEGRVFSIVFLGINGVGKSTNLAKVAYHLKHVIDKREDVNRQVSDVIAFRCLDVPLFERGYGKDAAAICREAMAHAQQTRADVVLVDTAGRMQDNEPLMRALGKLVQINNPDLILFVGEALVGNDAVDQLKKFNQALVDTTGHGPNPRLIDGILLTKFDTVDDKAGRVLESVGAALSMTYITGQPVVFVGTGQKYQNLKKLSDHCKCGGYSHLCCMVEALLIHTETKKYKFAARFLMADPTESEKLDGKHEFIAWREGPLYRGTMHIVLVGFCNVFGIGMQL